MKMLKSIKKLRIKHVKKNVSINISISKANSKTTVNR